ncbi:uncharacterized protein [Rutidosis leptorrhynchoides]|uniref:uncharacterized protein n=1 Tax=Rutidosis leptorrhynchoides TaxID=125765 RepID=UPI003A98F44D
MPFILEINSTTNSGISFAPSLTPPTDKLDEWFDSVTCVGCDELDISGPGIYAVQAEIIAVLPDDDWCYIACKKCYKKANTIDPLVDLTLGIDDLLALKRKCSGKCGDCPKPVLRFKVSVRVADKTDETNGTASFTLFETQVSKFVTKTAYQLQKSLPEGQEQPDELDELIGNVLIFKVAVTENTLSRESPVYTVKDATGDSIFIDKFAELYNKFKGGKPTKMNHSVDTSSQPSASTKCGSNKVVEDVLAVNLGTSSGYTPPKKVIKKEPTESPLSVKSSTTKAKKSIQLDN